MCRLHTAELCQQKHRYFFFFFLCYGDHRVLPLSIRRQRHVCIRDRLERARAMYLPPTVSPMELPAVGATATWLWIALSMKRRVFAGTGIAMARGVGEGGVGQEIAFPIQPTTFWSGQIELGASGQGAGDAVDSAVTGGRGARAIKTALQLVWSCYCCCCCCWHPVAVGDGKKSGHCYRDDRVNHRLQSTVRQFSRRWGDERAAVVPSSRSTLDPKTCSRLKSKKTRCDCHADCRGDEEGQG